MMKIQMSRSWLAMTVLLYSLAPSMLYACPLCKEAISKMGEVWTSLGFNWSIYLMISVPFILVGCFAAVLYLNYKKHHRVS